METEIATRQEKRAAAGKYLTFRLGDEEYGLEILRVREIIGLMDITPVPRTPDFIRGVINLRGRIIPVLNLRARFGLEQIEDHKRSCIIVMDAPWEGGTTQVGIHVDSVREVLAIQDEEIEPSPNLGHGVDTQFVLGVAKCKEGVRLLLDTTQILSPSEMDRVASTSKSEVPAGPGSSTAQ